MDGPTRRVNQAESTRTGTWETPGSLESARRKSLVTGLVVGVVCGGVVGGIAGAMLSNGYGYPTRSREVAGEPPGVPGTPPGRVYGTNEPGTNGNGRMTGDDVRKTTANGYGTPLYPNMPAGNSNGQSPPSNPGTGRESPTQLPGVGGQPAPSGTPK